MNKNYKKGEMITVVVISLVLALATSLGWIFYQNFVHKEEVAKDSGPLVVVKRDNGGDKSAEKKNTQPKTSEKPPKKPAVPAGYVMFEGSGYKFAYPESWGTLQVVSGGGSRDGAAGSNGKIFRKLKTAGDELTVTEFDKSSYYFKSFGGHISKYFGDRKLSVDSQTGRPIDDGKPAQKVYSNNVGDALLSTFEFTFAVRSKLVVSVRQQSTDKDAERKTIKAIQDTIIKTVEY